MNIKPTKLIKLESIVIVSCDSERQDEMEGLFLSYYGFRI